MTKIPELKPVSSSNVAAMGHSEEGLFVQFHGGSVYHYPDVPEETFVEGLGAKSVGSWFHRNIRNRSFSKL